MKTKKIIGITLLLLFIAGFSAFAAPARVTAKPVDDSVKIYGYKKEPLMSLNEEKPGFLVEVAKEIVRHPTMAVTTEVSPVAVLMKYSLIQSVGVCAIGTEGDFSAAELHDLLGISLFEDGGKTYQLFFNTLNPQGQPLYETAIGYLEEIKADGTFDSLKAKYGLE